MQKKWTILILIIVAGVFTYQFIQSRIEQNRRKFIADVLKLKELPGSFVIEEYDGWGVTDVLVQVVAEIDPNDFPSLIDSRQFDVRKKVSGVFQEHLSGPKIGKPYEAKELYEIQPSEFEHGGAVTLISNAEHTKIAIDIWIE